MSRPVASAFLRPPVASAFLRHSVASAFRRKIVIAIAMLLVATLASAQTAHVNVGGVFAD